MSKLSFISFCVEYYAEHIGKASSEVYALFKKEGVLDMLEEDYGDLHGTSMEYLMQFIDEYLGEKFGEKILTHATIRATILPEIIKLICQNLHVTENQALDMFYTSKIGECFSDDDTGLYGQSPLYIYGLFKEEINCT